MRNSTPTEMGLAMASELKQLRAAFETQRANYIQLYEAVMGGDGAITCECHDVVAIAKRLHAENAELKAKLKAALTLTTESSIEHARNK